MRNIALKHLALALAGAILMLNDCATQGAGNTSVKNTVYILESVKDIPTGIVFSFRDYCIFNAERGAEDSVLDKTLAKADAKLELHFADGTAELRLRSANGDNSTGFLEYQKSYASRFFYAERENTVELTLNINTLDEDSRASIMAMPAADRDAVLKSVFEKSGDLLIEPDEEDEVINYWRRAR
jgi:hypothetical protein